MKYETLLKRYKNLGYPVKNLERDLEIASIIKWVYDTYNYYVDCHYIDLNFKDGSFHKFKGSHRSHVGKPHGNSYYYEKSFDSPYDALFDALRGLYKHLNFMGDTIKANKFIEK